MKPWVQNVLAGTSTVVYIKSMVAICDFAVAKGWLPVRISRKILHVAAGCFVLFWPWFTLEHWTWRLNIIFPAMYNVQLLVEGAIIRDPNSVLVNVITRNGDPTELLYGPFLFTLVLDIVGLFFFRQEEGVMIMACLGLGDGIAPLTGEYFAFGHYPTWPFDLSSHEKEMKTLSGSLGFLFGSLLGYYIFHSVLIDGPCNWSLMWSVASMASITEGMTGKFDNLLVPIMVYVVCNYL